jgi:hypothetical protein
MRKKYYREVKYWRKLPLFGIFTLFIYGWLIFNDLLKMFYLVIFSLVFFVVARAVEEDGWKYKKLEEVKVVPRRKMIRK